MAGQPIPNAMGILGVPNALPFSSWQDGMEVGFQIMFNYRHRPRLSTRYIDSGLARRRTDYLPTYPTLLWWCAVFLASPRNERSACVTCLHRLSSESAVLPTISRVEHGMARSRHSHQTRRFSCSHAVHHATPICELPNKAIYDDVRILVASMKSDHGGRAFEACRDTKMRLCELPCHIMPQGTCGRPQIPAVSQGPNETGGIRSTLADEVH
jgi:hypothetical protein